MVKGVTINLAINAEANYYNRTALLHIAFLVVLYVLLDGFLLDYGGDEHAYSKSFYAKLVLMVLYSLASKEIIAAKLAAVFDFSVLAFALWLVAMSFMLLNMPLSRGIGLFIIFSSFSASSLARELLLYWRLQANSSAIVEALIRVLLKALPFILIALGLYFIIAGQWRWDAVPFYRW